MDNVLKARVVKALLEQVEKLKAEKRNHHLRALNASATKTKPKLVLHFDVNETIMVGDPAAGVSFEECLNMILAKSVLIREDGSSWADGSPVGSISSSSEALPPTLFTEWESPPGYTKYYRLNWDKEMSKNFTEAGKPGERYRGWYCKLEQALRLPAGQAGKADRRLSHDGVHFFLLPAFFKTISELARQGRTFAIVIRTFGTDISDVIAAIQAYVEGALHDIVADTEPVAEGKEGSAAPLLVLKHPPVQEVRLEFAWNGKYDKESGVFTLSREESGKTGKETEEGADQTGTSGNAGHFGERIDDEQEVVRVLQGGRHSISAAACTDDYAYWKAHQYTPSCGKPMWVTEGGGEDSFLHIFFDDNINNDAADSIVAIRSRGHDGQVRGLLIEVVLWIQCMAR
jgi:hypothetical protein